MKKSHLIGIFSLLATSMLAGVAMATPGAEAPPIEETAKVDEQKLQVAKTLTDWLNHTLQEKRVLVAVVAREGGPQTKKQDLTGMGHAGLAVYDPRAQSWLIYNLLNNTQGKEPIGHVWRSGPIDFFYGQKGYNQEALLLIPDTETQQRMYTAILNGNYKRLYFTENYNLVSAYDGPESLNCNKWLLMNLAAARIDDYEPSHVLNAIHTGFKPGLIHLNPLERQLAKTKSTIRSSEIPAFAPIQTVTVESLYRSNLFSEKRFYSGKSLD